MLKERVLLGGLGLQLHDLASPRDDQAWAEVTSEEYVGWALGCGEFL